MRVSDILVGGLVMDGNIMFIYIYVFGYLGIWVFGRALGGVLGVLGGCYAVEYLKERRKVYIYLYNKYLDIYNFMWDAV